MAEHQKNPAAELSIHGVEKTDETGRLCRLNLAVHGLEGDIRHGGNVNSYYDDPHDATGNSASDARSSELEIRRQLIASRVVDVMVAVGPAISNARTAREVSGQRISDQFVDVNKLVDLGSGSQREIEDYLYGTLGEVFFVEGDFWQLNTSLHVQDFSSTRRWA